MSIVELNERLYHEDDSTPPHKNIVEKVYSCILNQTEQKYFQNYETLKRDQQQ